MLYEKWSQQSWPFKLYTIATTVLASSSLATLSETIFKWKGFIKDALSLYAQWISTPILNAIAHFLPSWKIPEGAVHLLILSSIYISACARSAKVAGANSEERNLAITSIARYVGVCLAVLAGVATSDQNLTPAVALGAFCGCALATGFLYMKCSAETKLSWLFAIAAPFMLIGVLAAINSGLRMQ